METQSVRSAISTSGALQTPTEENQVAVSWGDLGECQHHTGLPKPAVPLAEAALPGGQSFMPCLVPTDGGGEATQVGSCLMAILWHKGGG